MATGATTFGSKGYATSGLNANFSGGASAGDWLLVVVSAYGAGSGTDPVVTDDVSGATGWSKVVDHLGDSGDGSTDFHGTWWEKECVGGETTVFVTPGSGTPDIAFNGVQVRTPTQPNIYIIDQGQESVIGGRNQFTCGNAPVTNNESYFVLTANGTVALVSTGMSNPSNTGGAAQLLTGAANTVVIVNIDEADNDTSQRPVIFDDASAMLFNYVVIFGTTDTTPPPPDVNLSGTGELLIGGDGELDVTAGSVDLSGAGHLLVAGEGALELSGGDVQLAGLGRLIGAGRARLEAPTPFPPVPNTPPLTGQLGCGVYDCYIFTRGLGTIVGRIPFNLLEWTRVLDDTSTAEVTVNGVSNVGPMRDCCALLGAIQPWKHEIGVYRNGRRVWSGPVLKVSYPSETVIIDAGDLSAWLAIRYLHENHNDVQQDLADIWVEYVNDAMSVDNSAGLFAIVHALTGVLADRLYTEDMHTFAADAISELARTGLDWSCVDRRMVGGPVAQQPAPYPNAQPLPTLIDESFRDAPTVDRDGSLMGNCWLVNGSGNGPGGNAIFGEYGPHFPATPDHVEQPAAPDYAEIEDEFGRIERVVSETKILDQPSIDQNAATRYDLTKRPVDVISSGTLLPTAGIDITQLIPGSLQNVHLTRACVQIGAPYRLKQLTVTAQSDGAEQVEGAWEPVGSVAAHEDLG